LTATANTVPLHGTATYAANVVTYTPAANYVGPDTFTYTLSDGQGGTAIGTVNVTVTGVNDAPLAAADTITTAEDTATTLNVVTNDSDADGGTLSAVANTAPLHGTATYAANVVTYTPVANYNGSDTFTYRLSDGQGGMATGTVNVTVTSVNDAPVAVTDTITTAEDTAVTRNVVTNDTDVDAGTLTAVANTAPLHGTATYAANVVTYTPAANYIGPDTFTYTLSDGQGGTATGTVNVTVTGVNDPPVAVTDTLSTAEDTATTRNVVTNDSDPDGGTLSAVARTAPANGTASYAANVVTYTPAANFFGADTFTYTLSDGQGGTAIGTVNVSVISINDAPVAVTDAISLNEDTAVARNLVANDTDVDGGTLTASTNTPPQHGTASYAGNTVTYTPVANYFGPDSFTYFLADGQGGSATGTVNVTVFAVNDAPVAADSSYTTEVGTPIDITLLASDIEGNALSFAILSPPSAGTLSPIAGNQVTYTPSQAPGTTSFTFRANDGVTSSAPATIFITVNEGPPLDCCGGAPNAGACTCIVGTIQPCYDGPGNTQFFGTCRSGFQTCIDTATGSTWGACEGQRLPEPERCVPGDLDCDGQDRIPGGCACGPNDFQECYTGPAGTENVGQCRGGVQTCDAGTWSPCFNETAPLPNDCSQPSCTGAPNPGCQCINGDQQGCDAGVWDNDSACFGG
ncbi:MAG: tandem-95 repeat protein, partial [Deltaproteobacteria bacterium]|nr:tandem-95 repeat protein [Deltaproteobacteria bacterium]